MLSVEEDPSQLAEIAGRADSDEGQTLALIDHLGSQVTNETAATLAAMSTDEIACDLGNLVISTPGLQSVDQSENVARLGALAPVLYDLMMASLEAAVPALEDAGLEETAPDTTHLTLAIAEADQMILFL